MKRSGFTLVEMTLTSAVMALVIGGLMSFLTGAWRMSHAAMLETELMIRQRDIRDRILFHAAPNHDGAVWAGVLSGSGKGTENGMKVLMTASGTGLSDGRPRTQPIQLVKHETRVDGRVGGYLVNDGYSGGARETWFRPYGGTYLPERDWLDDSLVTTRRVFFLTLETRVEDETRRMCLTVPVFGNVQARNSEKLFERR